MKKLLIPLFSSLLLLTACGNSDESNKETAKNETKTHEKENKNKEKTQKKKNEQNNNQEKQENSESTEQVNEESVNDQTNIENSFTQQNVNEQNQQKVDSNQEHYQSNTQEPTYEEQMRANAEVAKQHGYTGIPNGDMGATEEMNEFLQNQNNNHKTESKPSNWIQDQIDWNNATESEKEQIRKNDAEKYGVEYNPEDYIE
ncbi:hypothetical protein MUA82_05795 [Staphylococcus simulans]|uniref:hypothetical protein n=1 Tax=Staphylococcus simulans TaxID=1286 RepID=UPI0021CF97C4|nr:hypothetical protein [Staphylococcus simulans]UXR53586.1 hypothetical protein MUA82_05795 [Staphylococcus simulans]